MNLSVIVRDFILYALFTCIHKGTASPTAYSIPYVQGDHHLEDSGFDDNSNIKNDVYPDQYDCRFFHTMDNNGNTIRQECSEGKLFDFDLLQCEPQEEANCFSQQDDKDSDSIIRSSKLMTEEFECPFPVGRFPDPEDCTMYYHCLVSSVRHRICKSNKLFDKIKRRCASKNTVDCSAKIEEYPFKCSKKREQFPYPSDCSKYYLCKSKRADVRSCKKRQLFDTDARECRESTQVDCGSRFNSRGDSPSKATTTEPTTEMLNDDDINISTDTVSTEMYTIENTDASSNRATAEMSTDVWSNTEMYTDETINVWSNTAGTEMYTDEANNAWSNTANTEMYTDEAINVWSNTANTEMYTDETINTANTEMYTDEAINIANTEMYTDEAINTANTEMYTDEVMGASSNTATGYDLNTWSNTEMYTGEDIDNSSNTATT